VPFRCSCCASHLPWLEPAAHCFHTHGNGQQQVACRAAGVEAAPDVEVPDNYPHFTPFVEDVAQYKRMYERSIRDPDGFWGDIAEEFHWEKKVGSSW